MQLLAIANHFDQLAEKEFARASTGQSLCAASSTLAEVAPICVPPLDPLGLFRSLGLRSTPISARPKSESGALWRGAAMRTRKMRRLGSADCCLEEEADYGDHFWRLERPSQGCRVDVCHSDITRTYALDEASAEVARYGGSRRRCGSRPSSQSRPLTRMSEFLRQANLCSPIRHFAEVPCVDIR